MSKQPLHFKRESQASQPIWLHEQEQHDLLQLMESIRDVVFCYRVKPERGFVYINSAVADMVGYGPAEYYAQADLPLKIVHPDDRRMVEWYMRGEVSNHPAVLRWIHKNGNVVWVEESKAPVYDGAGRLVAVNGTVRNVTDRIEALEKLKASEEKYRRLVENMTECFFYSHDVQGVFSYVSPSVTQLLGYPQQQFLAHPSRYLTKDCLQEMIERTRRSLRGEQQPPYEVTALHRDGGIRTFLVSEVPVFGPDRQIIAVEGVAQDITKHRQIEEIQLYLAAIVEYSDDAIVGATEEGRIVSWNSGAERMFGYSAEEVIGHSISMLQTREQSDQFAAIQERVSRGERIELADTLRVRKDGQRIPVSVKISPIRDSRREIIGVSGIVRDISENKRAEEALRKARLELEERVQSRTAELIEINKSLRREITKRREVEDKLRAHDEQLRAMTMELSLAEERERQRMATNLHDGLGQDLAVARMRLAELRKRVSGTVAKKGIGEIYAMLGEALATTRSFVFELSPPILYELGLEAALDVLCAKMREKSRLSITFEVQGQTQDGGMDRDVSVFLFRAVRELLVNVIKHAEATRVEVSIRRLDGKVQVGVSDDGVGLSLSEAHSGGFGLFSIRERLAFLGGELTIQPNNPSGTLARIVVPLPVCEEKDAG